MLMGCRSDADRMAEFCLNFDDAVKNAQSCEEMSANVDGLLKKNQPRLRERSICLDGTACLPCKQAVRIMLGECGNDPVLRPVLDEMNFSRTLREQ